MTAAFYCCGTFPPRQMRVISRWSSRTVIRPRRIPSFSSSTGRPSGSTAFAFAITFFITVVISSVGRCRRRSRRVAEGAFFGCRDLSCRILGPEVSGRIAPFSHGCALCPAAVSLPRNRRPAIRPSRLLHLHRFDVLEEFMLVSHAQLLFQLNDVALEQTICMYVFIYGHPIHSREWINRVGLSILLVVS